MAQTQNRSPVFCAVQGMEKGTFTRKKAELGLIYSNKAELGAKFKFIYVCRNFGDVTWRLQNFRKITRHKIRLYAE